MQALGFLNRFCSHDTPHKASLKDKLTCADGSPPRAAHAILCLSSAARMLNKGGTQWVPRVAIRARFRNYTSGLMIWWEKNTLKLPLQNRATCKTECTTSGCPRSNQKPYFFALALFHTSTLLNGSKVVQSSKSQKNQVIRNMGDCEACFEVRFVPLSVGTCCAESSSTRYI